jgi:hypothetical protein
VRILLVDTRTHAPRDAARQAGQYAAQRSVHSLAEERSTLHTHTHTHTGTQRTLTFVMDTHTHTHTHTGTQRTLAFVMDTHTHTHTHTHTQERRGLWLS